MALDQDVCLWRDYLLPRYLSMGPPNALHLTARHWKEEQEGPGHASLGRACWRTVRHLFVGALPYKVSSAAIMLVGHIDFPTLEQEDSLVRLPLC